MFPKGGETIWRWKGTAAIAWPGTQCRRAHPHSGARDHMTIAWQTCRVRDRLQDSPTNGLQSCSLPGWTCRTTAIPGVWANRVPYGPWAFDDSVQWWPREHNKVADGLAVLTMNIRRSWVRRFRTSMPVESANVLVQTDVGFRVGCCAASAWISGQWGIQAGTWTYEVFVGAGFLIDMPYVISFRCEGRCLRRGLPEVHALLTSCNSTHSRSLGF